MHVDKVSSGGGELFWHLHRAGRLTLDRTRFYAAEMLLAIDFLHEHNVSAGPAASGPYGLQCHAPCLCLCPPI